MQLDSLFQDHEPCWRFEIRIKAGGGPFDPAGWSLMVQRPTGGLELMDVHATVSVEDWNEQARVLVEAVRERLLAYLDDELNARKAAERRRERRPRPTL